MKDTTYCLYVHLPSLYFIRLYLHLFNWHVKKRHDSDRHDTLSQQHKEKQFHQL